MKFNLKTLSALTLASLGLISTASFADAADVEKNLHKLNVPDGFKVEVYAEVPGARQMALGQSLFLTTLKWVTVSPCIRATYMLPNKTVLPAMQRPALI